MPCPCSIYDDAQCQKQDLKIVRYKHDMVVNKRTHMHESKNLKENQ